MSFELRKHFDVRGYMPANVWREFVRAKRHFLPGSMCEFHVYGSEESKPLTDYRGQEILWQEDGYIVEKGDCIVSDWFMDNGAEFDEIVIAEY
jgi:hypothetical protein